MTNTIKKIKYDLDKTNQMLDLILQRLNDKNITPYTKKRLNKIMQTRLKHQQKLISKI